MTLTLLDRVDPARLIGERWFASGGDRVVDARLEERFTLAGGSSLGIVGLALAGGRRARYTLPLDEGARLWSDLAALAGRGGEIGGDAGGALVGSPGRRWRDAVVGAPAGSSVRPLGIDQSNTSVVVDETLLVKLYRRIVRGRNPEAELLEALAVQADAPVPAFHGAVRLQSSGGSSRALADVAIVQRYVAGADDVFERFAETLGDRLRQALPDGPVAPDVRVPEDPLLVDIRAAGRSTAALHAALARLDGRAFAPRRATRADHERWRARAAGAWRAAERSIRPVDASIADELVQRRGEIEAGLVPLRQAAVLSLLTRIHGDLHLGQLIRDGFGFLVADLEGEPTRSSTSRRQRDLPLRDVASMLRSIDHVARSATRRSGTEDHAEGPDPWIADARAAYLGSYEDELSSWDVNVELDPTLLHALEMEKELYEFTYAAGYLPAWRYAPAGGLRWLLDRNRA